MKKFTLGCENEHEFEGWFADADAIRKQAASGLLDCPFCASTKIEKRLSAPNLSTPKTKARIVCEQQKSADNVPAPVSPPPAPAAASAVLAGSSSGEGAAALRMAVRALHQKKSRLNLPMSAINLQMKRVKSIKASLTSRIFTGPVRQKNSANWQKTV